MLRTQTGRITINVIQNLDPKILAQLDQLAGMSSYPIEAYKFVLSEFCQLMLHRGFLPEQSRGVSDHLLCWRLHDRAFVDYGEHAREKLAEWNVRSTKDFGKIVYGLVGIGLIGMEKQDSEQDFMDVFDFRDAFHEPHFKPAPLLPTRWRVSAMLALTTVFAIAIAGISNSGMEGAMGTLLSTWLIIIGGFTAYLGVSDRSKDWLLAVVAGILFLLLGMIGFVANTN